MVSSSDIWRCWSVRWLYCVRSPCICSMSALLLAICSTLVNGWDACVSISMFDVVFVPSDCNHCWSAICVTFLNAVDRLVYVCLIFASMRVSFWRFKESTPRSDWSSYVFAFSISSSRRVFSASMTSIYVRSSHTYIRIVSIGNDPAVACASNARILSTRSW